MYFKLLPNTGNHSAPGPDGKVVIYNAGDVIESDQDLEKAFVGKFQKVGPDGLSKPAAGGPKSETVQNPLGKDRTEKFPRAEEEDFKVFYKRGKGFTVVEADDPTEPLHPEPLQKDGVVLFIEEYLTAAEI